MSAVIYEVTPEHEGWVRLHDRVWKRPDGSLYEFPPWPNRELILKFERLPPSGVLDLTKRV
jgi:hypothetical protein